MSGSLKLKIKLKPRPQETDSALEQADHKRKLGDYSSQHPTLPSAAANGDHSEVRRSKKQKQNHPVNPPSQSTGSIPKVKLHIKGPWNKAATASENKDSPLRQTSSGQPFQSQSPSKSALGHPVLSIKQRPPAKAVHNLGQADGAAPAKTAVKKTKLKGFAKGKQHLPDAAPDGTQSRGPAVSKDSSERANLEAADASIGQPPKPEGHGVAAVPTRPVLERIVDKTQRKDTFNIFRDPITEAVVCFVLLLRLQLCYMVICIALTYDLHGAGSRVFLSCAACHGLHYYACQGAERQLQHLARVSGTK